jgi:MoxR-like ATPase
MRHHKFDEARKLVEANQPVLLTGEKGSGKTTLAKHIAEDLGLPFFSISMTRQTTLSHLLGFLSVNGTYVPSMLFNAVSNGGMMLLDELDAADANVLLSLNTIENGYVSFPTGIVECHKDFRLVATSNPQDQHHHYTGRVKLDGATLDRFDIIDVDRDADLEKSLVDADTYRRIILLRDVLQQQNSSIIISMRASLRYQKRKELGLLDGFIERLVDHNPLAIQSYKNAIRHMPAETRQDDCKTAEDLWDLAVSQSK